MINLSADNVREIAFDLIAKLELFDREDGEVAKAFLNYIDGVCDMAKIMIQELEDESE